MSRVMDFSNTKELLSVEGEFDAKITEIIHGETAKGTEYDAVIAEVEIDDETYVAEIKVYIPQEMTAKKMSFLRRQWRLLGLDVSGSVDIETAIGNMIKISSKKETWEITDELGDPTGEIGETMRQELIENV